MLNSFNRNFLFFALITLILFTVSLDGKLSHSRKKSHKHTRPIKETTGNQGSKATTLYATGHYLGKRPTASWLSANTYGKSSDNIQAAECSHNLRLDGQVFAYFEIDASKAEYHGAPYGKCYAVTSAPLDSDLADDKTNDVFFWNELGGDAGVGTGPIRNPQTGLPGYEDRHGLYKDGENPDKNPAP